MKIKFILICFSIVFSVNLFAKCKLSANAKNELKNLPSKLKKEVNFLKKNDSFQEIIWLLKKGNFIFSPELVQEFDSCLNNIMKSDYKVIKELTGITGPKLVKFKNSKVMGVLKKSDEYSKVEFEVLAYEIDQLLNLNFIPKTILVNQGRNSIQYFVKNLNHSSKYAMEDYPSILEGITKMNLFDFLTSNYDRHDGNYFIFEYKNMGFKMVVGIDHGLLFRDNWFKIYNKLEVLDRKKKYVKDYDSLVSDDVKLKMSNLTESSFKDLMEKGIMTKHQVKKFMEKLAILQNL